MARSIGGERSYPYIRLKFPFICIRCHRSFVYGYSVLGRQFCKVDQLSPTNTPVKFWDETPVNVVHLPQNRLESLLRLFVQKPSAYSTFYFGSEARSVHRQSSEAGFSIDLTRSAVLSEGANVDAPPTVHADFVVAADGAHSGVRKMLGIAMEGPESLQTMLNVHFTCRGLSKLLTDRYAMLYFTFNEVRHAIHRRAATTST